MVRPFAVHKPSADVLMDELLGGFKGAAVVVQVGSGDSG